MGLIYAGITLNKKNEKEDKSLISITYKELDEKLKNKESFILVISRTDCSHCASFKPKLKTILTDNKINKKQILLFFIRLHQPYFLYIILTLL